MVSTPQSPARMPSNRTTLAFVWLSNSLWRISLLYLCSLLAATGLFQLTEGKSFGDSFYWSFVTSLSIGYGDISPSTVAGRVMLFFFAHFWIYFIAALIIVNIIERVRFNKHEYSHDEQEYDQELLRSIALRLGITPPPPPSDTEHGDLPDED